MTTSFTMRELAECCEREAHLRSRVYPRWIDDKRISKAKAERELALMNAAAEHFTKLADETEGKDRLL
jgi:hypothetical protein